MSKFDLRSRFAVVATVLAVAVSMALVPSDRARADDDDNSARTACLDGEETLFQSLEGFKINATIDKQNGWGVANPAWDEEVVNAGGNTVWRVSNAVTSSSFGDMPFAPRLGGIPANTVTNPTNDSPGAFAGESSTGTVLKFFRADFSFRSATGAAQPGARITISADNGEGGRQSFIAIADTGSGLEMSTFDVDSGGNFIGPIVIATNLSYTRWHTTRVEILFRDGPDNDIVKYFLNGKKIHTNGSWEQFYLNFQAALHPLGVPVQTYLFRLSGTPAAVLGNGFYIDELCLSVAKSGASDDRRHNDHDDDDDDKDGKHDDDDDDDDNDGSNDFADTDDDNDGIEDAFDSRITYEDQSSFAINLGSGAVAEYPLAAGADTVSVTGVLADGLAMDVVTPVGTVVSSLPSVGRTVVTAPTTVPGNYLVRVRNAGVTSVASQLTLIRSTRPGVSLGANSPS